MYRLMYTCLHKKAGIGKWWDLLDLGQKDTLKKVLLGTGAFAVGGALGSTLGANAIELKPTWLQRLSLGAAAGTGAAAGALALRDAALGLYDKVTTDIPLWYKNLSPLKQRTLKKVVLGLGAFGVGGVAGGSVGANLVWDKPTWLQRLALGGLTGAASTAGALALGDATAPLPPQKQSPMAKARKAGQALLYAGPKRGPVPADRSSMNSLLLLAVDWMQIAKNIAPIDRLMDKGYNWRLLGGTQIPGILAGVLTGRLLDDVANRYIIGSKIKKLPGLTKDQKNDILKLYKLRWRDMWYNRGLPDALGIIGGTTLTLKQAKAVREALKNPKNNIFSKKFRIGGSYNKLASILAYLATSLGISGWWQNKVYLGRLPNSVIDISKLRPNK